MSWKDFENRVKELLSFDRPKLTPGSGSSKTEEDVVGINLIAQCKSTESKNISILQKDMDRLTTAAKLLEKFPLFFNQTESSNTVTLCLEAADGQGMLAIKYALSYLAVMHGLKVARSNLSLVRNTNELDRISKHIEYLVNLGKEIQGTITKEIGRCQTQVKCKYDDLTIVDLFEAGNNES